MEIISYKKSMKIKTVALTPSSGSLCLHFREFFLFQADPFIAKYKDAEVDVASFAKPFLDTIEGVNQGWYLELVVSVFVY